MKAGLLLLLAYRCGAEHICPTFPLCYQDLATGLWSSEESKVPGQPAVSAHSQRMQKGPKATLVYTGVQSGGSGLPAKSGKSGRVSTGGPGLSSKSGKSVRVPTGVPGLSSKSGKIGRVSTASANTGCTNTSTFRPLVWREDTNLPCCLTKIVEPECTEITSEVCIDHVETICVLATTMECTQTLCPVEVTMPVQETNDFEPWDCQDIWVTETYTATRAVEVEKTTTICDDKWCTGDDGEMFRCGEVNCVENTYTVPELQKYQKEESVKASNCTQLPPIEYLTCQNMTMTQEQLCTTCEPRVISECKSQTRPECIESTSKTCKPQTQTECNFKALEPYQEFQPKKRCHGHSHNKEKQKEVADVVKIKRRKV